MKKYFLSLVAAVSMIACTSADSLFGNDMIPDSEQMQTRIDSSRSVKTYQIRMDSCNASAQDYVYVGSMIDEMVGRTTMSFATNFTPDGFHSSNGDKLFGLNPVADSMIARFNYQKTPFFGDTTQRVEVSVYEIKNLYLSRAKTYYTNMDMTPYYDESNPVLRFKTNGQSSDTVHLPRWFFEKLVSKELNTPSETNPYRVDTMFYKVFNGFYFKSKPITSGRGLIPAFNINAMVTGMSLYYHNDDKDTLVMNYTFFQNNPRSQSNKYLPYSTTLALAQHDYSFANPAAGGVDMSTVGDLTTESSRCYVQGAGGLSTRAVIDMDHIKALKAKVEAEGFNHIALHKAELRWFVPEKSLKYYNDSFSKLILYRWKDRLMELIPDYNPAREMAAMSAGVSANEPIGGYLARSVGYYSQDITSFMQELISGTKTNPEVNLMPSYLFAYDPLRSVVAGSADPVNKPELILTYTLLR